MVDIFSELNKMCYDLPFINLMNIEEHYTEKSYSATVDFSCKIGSDETVDNPLAPRFEWDYEILMERLNKAFKHVYPKQLTITQTPKSFLQTDDNYLSESFIKTAMLEIEVGI